MRRPLSLALWILLPALLAGCGGGSGSGSSTPPPDTEGVTVSSVSPANGPMTGGNRVSVRGSGFSTGLQSLTFGGVAATDVSTSGDTTINATVPASQVAGAVHVVVTTSQDTGTLYSGYSYNQPPAVLGVVPAAGWSGVTVSILGFNFVSNNAGRPEVYFGQYQSLLPQVVNDTLIFATVPNGGGGLVDITVINDNGTGVLENGFLFYQVGKSLAAAVFASDDPEAEQAALYAAVLDAEAGVATGYAWPGRRSRAAQWEAITSWRVEQ